MHFGTSTQNLEGRKEGGGGDKVPVFGGEEGGHLSVGTGRFAVDRFFTNGVTWMLEHPR